MLINLFYLERGHSQNHPKATERKENVRCTFLANGRAGALVISCHPYQVQGRNQNHPKDDN